MNPKFQILAFVGLLTEVVAGPIKDMVTNDPSLITPYLESASYADRLDFIKRAYAEYKAENNDPVLQYTYAAVAAAMPTEMALSFANDFLLVTDDLHLKTNGAEVLLNAAIAGRLTDPAQSQQLVAKVKAALGGLPKNNRAAFEFANTAAEALVFVGDDAGLDIMLTDSTTTRTRQTGDHWGANSDASIFADLVSTYQSATPTTPGLARSAKKKIKFYELCRLRRLESKEVKSLNPAANLDELMPTK